MSGNICLHPKLISLPLGPDGLYGIACTSCGKRASLGLGYVSGEKSTEFCLSAFIEETFGDAWGQRAAKDCRCARCKSEPVDLFPSDPHPVAFQEKLARLGWGAWQPTPGVTDEGAVLYITIGEKSTFIMTTDEALTLSDADLQARIESAIGMSYEEACKIPRVSGGDA